MKEFYSRTTMLIGEENINILKSSHVAVFGIGGVGGFVAEALARCGVGTLTLVDNDTVSKSNINRQIIALDSTVGMHKTEAMAKRIYDINPDARVITGNIFLSKDNIDEFDFSHFSYVADAIDTVSSKILIAQKAFECATPLIMSMGAGNKLHPELFEIADISKTSVCPLARVMRTELKKRGISGIKCVYSKETPVKTTAFAPISQSAFITERIYSLSYFVLYSIPVKKQASVRLGSK